MIGAMVYDIFFAVIFGAVFGFLYLLAELLLFKRQRKMFASTGVVFVVLMTIMALSFLASQLLTPLLGQERSLEIVALAGLPLFLPFASKEGPPELLLARMLTPVIEKIEATPDKVESEK